MATTKKKAVPTWSEVKAKLALFDRAGLIGLISNLHSLSPDNQAFLHARLGLGPDPLAPYKATISRWIYPDFIRGQNISVARAKKAISDYRKAIGLPDGIAELSVFYCESAARLISECGMEDEGYFTALVRIFDQALAVVAKLNPLSGRRSTSGSTLCAGPPMPSVGESRTLWTNCGPSTCGRIDARSGYTNNGRQANETQRPASHGSPCLLTNELRYYYLGSSPSQWSASGCISSSWRQSGDRSNRRRDVMR